MSSVSLKGISKWFGRHRAVNDVSIDVPSGAFLTLLGPSGCGKTTTLRILAGLEGTDAGSVHIGGDDVTGVSTYRRNIGMVFQSMALFPHMSVGENVAFGLAMRGMSKTETKAKVQRALSLVHLEEFASRRPHQLSGGQQQRVALARALVYEPKLLLLDEPFAALDRKLREAMQVELRTLTKAIGITTIFVTHDQEEALVMSDLVAVMKAGVIDQCGSPAEIYERPRTRFVADFMGFRNILDATSDAAASGGRVLRFLGTTSPVRDDGESFGLESDAIAVAIRPQRIRIAAAAPSDGSNHVGGELKSMSYHGSATLYEVAVQGQSLFVEDKEAPTSGGSGRYRVGDRVVLSWNPESVHVLRGA